MESDFRSNAAKQKLLEGIPCGSSFPNCKFIRDANAADARLPTLRSEKTSIKIACEEIQQNIKDMDAESVQNLIADS